MKIKLFNDFMLYKGKSLLEVFPAKSSERVLYYRYRESDGDTNYRSSMWKKVSELLDIPLWCVNLDLKEDVMDKIVKAKEVLNIGGSTLTRNIALLGSNGFTDEESIFYAYLYDGGFYGE
jgi:hypothetical protein